MRKLVGAVLVLAALYAGYWVVGSRAVDHGIRRWFDAQRAAGWTADYDSLTVRGFPSRFDVTIEGLDLRDPISGIGWQAPFWQVLALSYQPQHYIAVWPHAQSLHLPEGDLAVTSKDMRASLVFYPGPSFALNHMALVVDTLAIRPANGDGWQMASFRFAVEPAPDGANAYHIGLDLRDLRLPDALRQRLGAGALPATLDNIHLDAVVGLDAPLDRHALQGGRPRPKTLHLADASARWGDLGLRVSGDLTFDAAGRPEGRLQVDLRQWHRLLDLAIAAGLLPESRRKAAAAALTFAGAGSADTDKDKDKDSLSLPLTFQGGFMALGALPLGRAPRIGAPGHGP